jgi:2-dehydro-3-deoxyphosphogluconate aldolase/(4S)-4-hydroxy-2-oxoglutarate aldolase
MPDILDILDVMRLAPVIPVVTFHDLAAVEPVTRALVAGGLPAIEVTMRTPIALDAMREAARVEGAVVGAGTVLSPSDLEAALAAGARFAVSPGFTLALAEAARGLHAPLLPGVATAGDIMRGLDAGLTAFKFFPAEAAGGRAALRALAAPFGAVRFCPTGGVTEETAPDWLAGEGVVCVGGSWLVPRGEPDPETIRDAAARAARLTPRR